jgi:hypothetical protein
VTEVDPILGTPLEKTDGASTPELPDVPPVAPEPEAAVVEAPVAPAPEPAPAPVPVKPKDTRQAWACVTALGPRTVRDNERCPIFHSDSHLAHIAPVCPRCGNFNVRMAEPDEV